MPVPFKIVVEDRLTNHGYKHNGRGVWSKHVGNEIQRVVMKNKGTLGHFRGYPQKVCALLVTNTNVHSLVSQDFYDLTGGLGN